MPFNTIYLYFSLWMSNIMSCFLAQEEKEFFEDVSEEELESGCRGEGLCLLGCVDGVPEFAFTLSTDIAEPKTRTLSQ